MTAPARSRPRRSARALIPALVVGLLGLQVAVAGPASAAPSVVAASVTEPSGGTGVTQLVFTVTRVLGEDATVDFAVVPGTATAGQDYLPPQGDGTGTIVFASNQTTAQLEVGVLGDTLNEGDETLTLNLTSSDGDASAVGTIHDDDGDDPPRMSIADATVSETNSGTPQATFAVTLNRPSGRTVTATYATTDGSATQPADYTPAGGTVTFDPGDLSETIAVPVVGDTLDEVDETFTVTLSGPTGEATLGREAATGLILDDDDPSTVSIADTSAAEGPGAAAAFAITVSPASGREIEVYATTTGGTAGPGTDFVGQGGEKVTIAPGSTEATFAVPLIDDSANESTEFFSVTLTSGTAAVIGRGTAIGTITDDDPGPKFSIDDVSVVEGNVVPAGMAFKVTMTGTVAPLEEYTVSYATADGTAKAPADYTAGSNQLTFSAAVRERTILLATVPETLAERDETFTVKLTNPTNGSAIAKDTGVGTIQNDDGAPAQITIDDPTLSEGAGPLTFTVNLAGAVGQPVLVNYQTKNGTALGGRDYATASGTLTFAVGGSTTATIDIPITEDSLDEADETFTVELSEPVNADFTDGVGTGTIVDNDAPPAVLVDAVPPIAEGDDGPSPADVTVRLSAESGREVRVAFTVVDGTALAGPDYSGPASGELVFLPGTTAPGETVQTLRVSAVGDTIDEADTETFAVRLGTATNATVDPALVNPGSALTIADDDDLPEVAIVDASVEEQANGSDTNMTFPVSLSAVSGRQVTVTVTAGSVSDTATEGGGASDDYSAPPATVIIPAGQQATAVVVAVNGGDGVDSAAVETFTLTLSDPQNATLDPDGTTATGTIFDADAPPTLRISGTTVGESVVGGTASITVNLFPASPSAAGVNYSTSDGSAQAPGDYTAIGATALAFAAGETVKTFDVTITSDAVDEADEAFTVGLDTPTGAAVGDGQGSAGIVILDDDGPVISVSSPIVAEGDSGTTNAPFVVSLSAPSPQGVSVNYATSGGTATSPADFAATSGSLAFAPGETSKPVGVLVVGDVIDEADETFTLALSAAGAATAGPPGVATIVDDDQPDVTVGAATLSTDDPSVIEGNVGVATMTFVVTLDEATTRDVVVDYVTADGSARALADYLPTAGRLTFAPGEVTKTVIVAVLGDERDEADETVALRLPSALNGTIVDATTLGTILDDDGPGYLMVASDGGIFAFGGAGFYGSTGNITLNQPIVGMARHPSGRGYWLVASDGGIFAFGEAGFFGSTGAIKLNRPIVGMTATPSGRGYWLVASDGGIFSFGDAAFFGSTGAIKLNQPIVGMASTPTGTGYWLVATDGGIFAFGDAVFQGSTGAIKLNRPVVGMTATPSGKGYFMVATDGGIFAFGDAAFKGSTGAIKLNQPIVGMATTASGGGYWLVASDGGIFAFGDAAFLGSTGNIKLNRPIVGMGA